MAHVIIITTPGGGGSLVAPEFDLKIDVAYTPDHSLTPEQAAQNIEKIERLSQRFYDKLQERLAVVGDD